MPTREPNDWSQKSQGMTSTVMTNNEDATGQPGKSCMAGL